MRASMKKLGLFLGMVFLSVSAMATTVDPPTIEKIEKDVNMRVYSGDVCTVALAECCEFMSDFTSKKDNALKVLRIACKEDCKTTIAGDYKFIDFVDREEKKVARLIVNENEKILMLITYDFKKFK